MSENVQELEKNVQYNVTPALRICNISVTKFLKVNLGRVASILLEPDHKYVYIFGSVYICGSFSPPMMAQRGLKISIMTSKRVERELIMVDITCL